MAKRIVDEEMRFSVIINGNEAQKELFELERSTRNLTARNKELRAEQAKLVSQGKKNSQEYKNLSAEIRKNNAVIKSNKARMGELQAEIGITGLTMGQLSRRAAHLKLQLRNMVPGSGEYKRLDAELRKINTRLKELRTGAKATRLSISGLANSFNKYAALGATVIASLTGVVLSLQKLIDYNGKLSDAQSNVRKTTELTKEEVDELTKSFGLMKTRTTRIELLKLAEEAGRLGIRGVDNIKGFLEVANELKVALGDDLSDTQIREVGKMVNIYQVGQQTGRNFEESMRSLGSAINEVAASGTNQADFLVEYMKRQAGVAVQARVSAAENIGYAATFDEIGQSVEVSATAMNKVWLDMFENTQTYADIAGMNIRDFSRLLQTDANTAMIRFLESLAGNNEGLAVMSEKLEDIEVGGSRGTQALAALASNVKLLKERQEGAYRSLQEATSLTDEYNLKNNNLAATIEKVKRRLRGIFASDFVRGGLKGLINLFGSLIGAVEDANKTFKKESQATFESAKANRQLANESEALLKEYETLTKDGIEPTEEAKQRLEEITLLLKDRLGESVVAVEKETGALVLNTEAVREQIKVKRLAADEEAATLVSRLKGTQEEKKRLQEQIPTLEKEYETRKRLADQARHEFDQNTKLQGRAKLGAKAKLEEVIKERDAWLALNKVKGQVTDQESRRIDILKKLRELNFTETDVNLMFKPNNQNQPEEGAIQIINGMTFVYKNGKWQPLTAFTPKGDPEAAKKARDLTKKEADALLKLQRQTEDNRLAMLQDAFERELAQAQANHRRKIENLKARLIDESKIQEARQAGNIELAETYLEQNTEIQKQIEQQEELHRIKLATIYENGITNALKEEQEGFEAAKLLRQTEHNNQLAALGSNRKAREKLTAAYNQRELEEEEKHLKAILAKYQELVSINSFGGLDLSILTPDQVNEISGYINQLKLKLSELGLKKQELSDNSGASGISLAEGTDLNTDILGFTISDWLTAFDNLDTLSGKIEFGAMAVQGLANAWGTYNKFREANMERELANFEQNQETQKQKLKERLDAGQISQKEYNSTVQAMEKEINKKRAEFEYKKAKREKEIQLMSGIAGTASAVIGALGSKPWTPANFVFASIVGALGLTQTGIIAGTKLPAKGYESGYYDKIPVRREQDGKVYQAAYGGTPTTQLVDKPTVFLAGEGGRQFPEMIIDGNAFRQFSPDLKNSLYSEVARVKGYEQGFYQTKTKTPEFQEGPPTDPILMATLARTNSLLDNLENILSHGIEAVVSSRNMQSMKRLKEGIEDYETLRNKNKR